MPGVDKPWVAGEPGIVETLDLYSHVLQGLEKYVVNVVLKENM